MRIMNGGGHQHIGFAAGIAEHQALIASAFIFIVARINTHRNIGRLFMQVILEFKMRMVKFVLLIADIFDRGAHCRLDRLHDAGQIILAGAHFAAQNHPVGGGKCLTGHTGLGLSC